MKKIFVVFSIICLFVSCSKQPADNSAIIRNQFIFGEWQSDETGKEAVLTFDGETVKVVLFYNKDKPSVYNYKYRVVGENEIYIYYSDVSSATNTRVVRIEGTVSHNRPDSHDRLDISCKYEKIDRLNLVNITYPVRTDESGLCAFHRFQRK